MVYESFRHKLTADREPAVSIPKNTWLDGSSSSLCVASWSTSLKLVVSVKNKKLFTWNCEARGIAVARLKNKNKCFWDAKRNFPVVWRNFNLLPFANHPSLCPTIHPIPGKFVLPNLYILNKSNKPFKLKKIRGSEINQTSIPECCSRSFVHNSLW